MKTAVVTGASYGIGRALAVQFGRRGYHVVAVSRNEERLQETVARLKREQLTASYFKCDLGDSKERELLCEHLAATYPDVRLLAHLATPRADPELESTLAGTASEQIDEYLRVLVGGTIHLTRALLPQLEKNSPSHMFIVASDWALRGAHGPSVFGAAKAALAQFGHLIRREAAKSGVRTTVIYPGDVASYDEAWEEPVWDIDDSVDTVISSVGRGRIPLSDFTKVVDNILSLDSCRVEEIVLAPLDGDYDY